MIDMPILKLELAGFRQTMMHALADYQGEISRCVSDQVSNIVTTEYFEGFIKSQVRETVQRSVKDAIESYFMYGEGRKMIDEVVNQVFKVNK